MSVGKTIATALVSSRLDFIITLLSSFSHSAPLLKSLHWLPVRYSIMFKICTITYQALSSKQPAYLHSLLTLTRQPRQLQSSNFNPLFFQTNVGTRAFSVAAPTLWNSLPVSVKSVGNITTFCCKLKTHLFKLGYPP